MVKALPAEPTPTNKDETLLRECPRLRAALMSPRTKTMAKLAVLAMLLVCSLSGDTSIGRAGAQFNSETQKYERVFGK